MRLEDVDYQHSQWAHLFYEACGPLFKLLGLFCLVYQVLILLVVIWRYCLVKYGKRVKPNGDLGILITGATSGFGLALAKLFYKLGFTIIATYFNDQESGYKELQELGSREINTNYGENFKQPQLLLVKMDVRSRESIEECGQQVDSLLHKHNVKLYCLINNAGIGISLPFPLFGRDTIVNSIGTNLTGSMLVTRQFLLRIVQNKGKVINVSSGTHSFPGAKNEVYGSTKAALYHFSLALHSEIKRYGASSVCVIPGNFVTASNIAYGNIKSFQVLKKNLTPDEKDLYQDLMLEFQEYISSVLAIKLKSGENLAEAAAIFDFKSSELVVKKSKDGILAKLVRFPLQVLSGKTSTLEAALEAYEQAVCVKNSPITLYPGNPLYTYYFGPLAELLPTIVTDWLGNYIVDSILRVAH